MRRNHSIDEYVRETLAAADPFYRGPRSEKSRAPTEPVRDLDPFKTEVDIGRIEPGPDGAPRFVGTRGEALESGDRDDDER